eukprot:CAMPEP_0198207392 /NCGR_PEP_ID=MMETSP1445-20131203/10846_1 /TAXON_ID=36898 /ORGANISM="Pyramimonas sp., Strain CCMP2087" /LENGTH=406 /DNA_ID=CAMNT_0043880401 /DNA_START=223 /DNA_END=1439 /DNA_ORIENTATION=+
MRKSLASSLWPWDSVGAENNKVDLDDEEEEAPTELNTLNFGNFLEVSTDKLSVRYVGEGAHSNDVGSIQANRPAPSQQLVFYYEVEVKDGGERGKIGVGFSDKTFKHSRQPGWELNSYGYHGDDGNKYSATWKGEKYSTGFTTGDVVGAGLHLGKREIFYTHNGKFIGIAFHDIKLPLYATVGLHSKNEHITVNFGQKPFVFDIAALIAEERLQVQKTVTSVDFPQRFTLDVVTQYLQHYGCSGTLSALLDASCGLPRVEPCSVPSSVAAVDMDTRAALRRLLLEGKVDATMLKMQQEYPNIWKDDISVAFHLHCQKFIELVRLGDVDAAVRQARAHLAIYRGIDTQADLVLQDVLALLAYEDPYVEPAVRHLLSVQQREVVADVLNQAILRPHVPQSGEIQEDRG